MPLQILLDEYQWVESLYWYDDNFVFKTASSFRIGIIQHIDLFLSSSHQSDAGESAFIEVRLDSPYLPSYAFTLQVLFLAQNSIELVYPTHNTDLILYSGQASEFLAPRFINGPNMKLTWHQTGEVTTSVQFSGYYRYTRFKAASLIPQNCSFVSLFTRSESFSVSKQATYIHLFFPAYYLTRCFFDDFTPYGCNTLPLPRSDNATLQYKVMASHFFTSFEVYSGSCELRVHLENFPFDSVPVLLPFDPPCAIQDTEMLVSITQNLLLVSDRNYGLQVYNVSVILEGYTYITLTTSPDVVELERNYTLKGLFRFDFVRSFTFGEQIGTLEAKLLSSEHLLLVKGYGSTNVFLLNIEDMRNPFIQRRFGNVFHTNSTSDVFSGGRSTLNERWVVSEVKSFHGGFSFWNIYDVSGASKLMPLQILLDEYQWVESLYWYDDNFVFKTASSFRIGIIQHIDLFLSSSRTSDAGESALIEVRLDSPYLPSYAFTLQVLFLAQNSIELVYPTHNTDLILYSGQASEFLVPRFINGPNMNLTWH